MPQNFTADWYAQSYNAATAFGQAEENDNSLKSNFSGASAPSNPVAGQSWYHTSKGLRDRNATNSAWLKVLQGDASSKCWFYRNDTAEGWLIDSSVTDRVLAIKGGSGPYNVSGGQSAGSWDTSGGLSTGYESAYHYHIVTNPHGHSVNTVQVAEFTGGDGTTPVTVATGVVDAAAGQTGNQSAFHYHPMNSAATWRPTAAVGTLQYPDLS